MLARGNNNSQTSGATRATTQGGLRHSNTAVSQNTNKQNSNFHHAEANLLDDLEEDKMDIDMDEDQEAIEIMKSSQYSNNHNYMMKGKSQQQQQSSLGSSPQPRRNTVNQQSNQINVTTSQGADIVLERTFIFFIAPEIYLVAVG